MQGTTITYSEFMQSYPEFLAGKALSSRYLSHVTVTEAACHKKDISTPSSLTTALQLGPLEDPAGNHVTAEAGMLAWRS